MTDEQIRYRSFLTVWKVLRQTRPGITNLERFILAIIATSDDKFERGKRLHPSIITKLRQKKDEIAKNTI